jgi:hypothetical protein
VWELFQAWAPRQYTWKREGGYLVASKNLGTKLERDCGVTRFSKVEVKPNTVTVTTVEGGSEQGCVWGMFTYQSERPSGASPSTFELDEIAWARIPDMVDRAMEAGENDVSIRFSACSNDANEICADVGRIRFDGRTGARR